MAHSDDASTTIIAMERAALDRWGNGDPSGFLEISAPDVTYFDTSLERRLDGLEALTSYYDGIRGKIWIDHYDMINPNIHVRGDVAVLTFNLISYGKEIHRWNSTEVYRKIDGNWRIIHTHWSITQSSI